MTGLIQAAYHRMNQDHTPMGHSFGGLEHSSFTEVISMVAEPLILLGSYAATVPYQLLKMRETYRNMRTYKVGDPRRIQDPRLTMARRGLSATGGILGTIGCVLGSGIYFAAGGSLKVATGVICLFTNARLFYQGCKQEKAAKGNKEALRVAQYNKAKGASGFLSSAVYIGYFILTLVAGLCPPVLALGALALGLSLLCAYLEKEGTMEKLYRAKDIIEKEGFHNWYTGNYDNSFDAPIDEDLLDDDKPEIFARQLNQMFEPLMEKPYIHIGMTTYFSSTDDPI